MNAYSISAQFQYRLTVRHQKSEERESEAAIRRRRTLRRVDSELEKGNFKAALSLVKQLQGKSAGLRGFGVAAAAKVPRSASYLDEANLSGDMEISSLNLIIDSIIHSIKCSLEFQLLEEQTEKVLVQEFGEVVDGESLNSLYEDHLMCVQHEAGHFLTGYMLGVLPKRYKVPSMKDLFVDKFASGKVEFIGFEFLSDVHITTKSNKKFTRGKLSKKTLKNFSCVILGGLVAEHISFGYSELLHSDVQKLDRVLKWLDLTENEIDSELRRAAENAVTILCCHREARVRLAEAMALGRSVGFCIETIERTLNIDDK